MIIREDIKTALKEGRRTCADLARKLDMNYEVLNRYINGRAPLSEELERQISVVLEEWDVQAK